MAHSWRSMHLEKCRFFHFGSYPVKERANDIDLLVVVPTVTDLDNVRYELGKLEATYPENDVHLTVYTEREYMNPENKFSVSRVTMEVPVDRIEDLYRIRLTKFST